MASSNNTISTASEDLITTPVSLWRKYNKDFVFPGKYNSGDSLYAGLRKDDGIFFNGAYDEPTYLTFRIEFDFDCDEDYAIAKVGKGNMQYNEMPHPLFNVIFNDVFRESPTKNDSKIDNDFLTESNLFSVLINDNNLKNPGNIYSTYNYLKFNLGEEYRALMLLKLKALLYDIQFNYPYYFTSIEGLQNLMKVDPEKGIRIPKENNTLTIKCNEALDLKITQLLNLYRKIVWDDVYQRWILPDMMRFFKLKIHIFEMRIFHEMSKTQSNDINSATTTDNTLSDIINGNAYTMISSHINELLPTLTIECRQCEFDLGDNMTHIGTLNSNIKQKNELQPSLKIHVGNISEIQSYNLNKITSNNYYSDKLLSKNRLYSDNDDYTGEEYKNESLSNSSSINRLGTYIEKDSYNTDRSLSTFSMNKIIKTNLVENAQDKSLNGIDKFSLPALSRTIMWPNMIQSIFDYGVNWVKGKTIDGVNWLLSQPIGKLTVGEILQSTAVGVNLLNEGNFVFFHNLLKNAIEENPAVKEYERTHEKISESLATMIIDKLPLSAATEINNALKDAYDISLKGTSNEAITDNDKGYVQQNLSQPQYISTANNGVIVDNMDPNNKGLSSEAIEDKDKGYVNRIMIQSPYISTANNGVIVDNMDPNNKGLSSEAIEDKDRGYAPLNLNQPKYISTANNGVIVDNMDPNNKGLSSEAIEDKDNGYAPLNLNQPKYISTANNGVIVDNMDPNNKGLSNEAIENKYNG